jgi:hypothetical protein
MHMTGRATKFALLGVMAAAGWAVTYSTPASLDGLVKNSPFSGPAATAGVASDAPLELRGVLVDAGEYFFSLYDPSSRTSMWVGLKEPGNPFIVQSYDSTKGVATVEYKGRTLDLALKQAKVVALAGNLPPTGPTTVTLTNAVPAPNSNEATRLAAVAEEIRRRRALRAQAVQTPAVRPANPPTRN